LSRASFWVWIAFEPFAFGFIPPVRDSSCRRSRAESGCETALFSRRALASALQLLRSPRDCAMCATLTVVRPPRRRLLSETNGESARGTLENRFALDGPLWFLLV
jgi:hypothetical protein